MLFTAWEEWEEIIGNTQALKKLKEIDIKHREIDINKLLIPIQVV